MLDVLRASLAARADAIGREWAIALRSLLRAPLLATAAILTLALAISMNSAIFSTFEAVIAAPLPYAHPGRLAFICDQPGGCGQVSSTVTEAVRTKTTTIDGVAAFQWSGATILGHGLPHGADIAWSTWNIFDVLGVKPLLGRFFTPADASYNVRRVVIRESVWRNDYDSDPRVIGKTIDLDGKGWTIIGVAPDSTYMPVTYGGIGTKRPRTLWMPLPQSALEGGQELNDWTIARIRRGVTLAQVDADLQRVDDALHQEHPLTQRVHIRAVRLADWFFRSTRVFVTVASIAVALVLLIAAVNVANLLLARTIARQGDIVIAYAVGASSRQIVTRLFAEAALLSGIGFLVALPLAKIELKLLQANLPEELPRIQSAGLDGRAIAFSCAVAVVVALVCAWIPILVLRRRDMLSATRGSRGSNAASSGRRTRALLVTLQIALAFVVIASSGVLVRSVVALAAQPIGFAPARIDVGAMALSADKYYGAHGIAERRQFYARMLPYVAAVPGVEDAAFAAPVPFSGDGNDGGGARLPGRSYTPATTPQADYTEVSPNYFRMLHIPLVRGRLFSSADSSHSQPVVVISMQLARELFADHDPVGRRLLVDGQRGSEQSVTIVGLIGDVRTSYSNSPDPALYFPVAQRPPNYGLLTVKVAKENVPLRQAIARAVARADRSQAIFGFWPLRESVAADSARQREMALLLGILGAIALALSLVGVFAIVSLSVQSRLHEIGVRMAIGARASDVLANVLRGSLALAFAGVAIGCVLAALALPGLGALVFDVAPADPVTLLLAAALVVIAIAVASFLPALRASHTDPSVALRYE